MCGPEEGLFDVETKLGAFTSDSSRQLDIFGHDGHPLGVNGAQIGVLEEPHKVSFSSFLKSTNSSALESEIGLEILRYLSDKTLEWQLANQQFS